MYPNKGQSGPPGFSKSYHGGNIQQWLLNQSSAGKENDTRLSNMASSGGAGMGPGNLNIHYSDGQDSQSASSDHTKIKPTFFENNLGQTYYDNNFENVPGSGSAQNSVRRQAWTKETSMETNEVDRKNKDPLEHTLKLFDAIEHLESLLSKSRGEMHDLLQQVGKTKGTNITSDAAQQQELEKELKRLRSKEDNLLREVEKLHNENKKLREDLRKEQDEKADALRQQHRQEKQKVDKQDAELKQLESDFQALRVNYEAVEKQLSKKTEECKKLTEDKNKVQDELSQCKTRLSQVMGNKLSNNNPDIADLSDKNRPTKLGEKYSEIYDNQWTDAFEVAEELFRDEQKSVLALKQLLMDIKSYCDAIHQQQTCKLLNDLGIDAAKHKKVDVNIVKQVKELRKSTAGLWVEHVFERYQKDQRSHASDYGWLANEQKMKPFVRSCVELCWLMLVQDPPLAFLQDPAQGETFNQERYKFYTKSGKKLHFVVWPALLLHDGGKVVSKGIAQAISDLDVYGKAAPKASIGQKMSSGTSTIHQTSHDYPPSQDTERTTEEVGNKSHRSHDVGDDASNVTHTQDTDANAAGVIGTRKNKNTLEQTLGNDYFMGSPTANERHDFKTLGDMYGYKSEEIQKKFGDRYKIIYDYFEKFKNLPGDRH